ncbi:MAG: glycine cleavage system protein GcvH [Gammaproteobacteria bacterium]
MNDIQYTEDHVWARVDGDGTATIGISDYAQQQLGDIVYIDLPEIGAECAVGEEISLIESVKSTSDVFAPLTGVVIEVNEALSESPQLINDSPQDDGWLFRIELEDEQELEELMDLAAYDELVESL